MNRVVIFERDIDDLDEAVKALFRAHEHTLAVRAGALALRLRSATGYHHSDAPEGADNVVELHGWSRKAPCA